MAAISAGMVVGAGTAYLDEGRAMWDYAYEVEVLIDRPAKDIWPYFFGDKKNAWTKTDHRAVAGESGKVGEVYGTAYRDTQLFYDAITVKPEEQLVLKITYKESEAGEPKLCGYDFITLKEVEGRTTVTLQQVFALPMEPETEKHDRFLVDIFQNLKRMVESSHA
jgi:hypothetical protein